MSSSIFLDSSLLIEYRKGTQTDLFEAIMAGMDWQPFISQAVVSEYLFFHLAIFSGKAPLTVKSNKEVGRDYIPACASEGIQLVQNLQDWVSVQA